MSQNDLEKHKMVPRLTERYVVPTYKRSLVLDHGKGSFVWDVEGKKYLDFGTGVAVNSLGHAHHELALIIKRQADKLAHCSNLYYFEPQLQLARKIVNLTGRGRVFFSNSGAEANEAVFKLARRYGHEKGRWEILTATNSFHGRTLATMSATGQEKIKKDFGPPIPGFRHLPFNDLDAFKKALKPHVAAIHIEAIQGEGGVHPATKEFLLGLRELTKRRGILLTIDAVQCGVFRTGVWTGYHAVLGAEIENFLPDAVAFAKGLGSGFPIGATWILRKHTNLLGPGSHGSTFGGSPLACKVGSEVLNIIARDKLDENIRTQGARLVEGVREIQKDKSNIEAVRGFGGFIGIQIKEPASEAVGRLTRAGLLTVPAGEHVIRLLPPLNVAPTEIDEALDILKYKL